jgi:NADH oxidase (H2O2-forming)
VSEIRVKSKIVVTKKNEQYPYDTLVITAGALPVKPPILGVDTPNVFTLRTIEDARAILKATQSAKSAVIIGASFIGLEVAEALKSKGLSVVVVEALRTMWRALDEDMSPLLVKHFAQQDIRIIENSAVTKIEGRQVHLKDEVVTADIVIIAAGVRAENTFARKAGIEIGPTGGIKVNERLETSIKDIYAAGDCAEVNSALTGEPMVIGLGTIAARQGVVVGINAAGGEAKAPPVLNSSVLRVFGLEVGSVGFTESYLSSVCQSASSPVCQFKPVSLMIKSPSLPHYYPGGVDIHTKLIADMKTHRVIGGQIIGKTPVAQRVNTLALAIGKGATIEELVQADFCYSPPVADVWDPLAIAAQGLVRKLSLGREKYPSDGSP